MIPALWKDCSNARYHTAARRTLSGQMERLRLFLPESGSAAPEPSGSVFILSFLFSFSMAGLVINNPVGHWDTM